jgi:hypothetical protein
MKSYQKAALFGGVYNNSYALAAACALAQKRGADGLFCLGDLGGFGPHPDKVFPLLDQYNMQCIQGNYEESLAARRNDCGCGYTHPDDNRHAALSYDYTHRHLSDAHRARLAAFPKFLQFNIGPLTAHLCHGSPRRVNEFLWESATSDAFVAAQAQDKKFNILCCTHTGLHWSRQAAPNVWIVNTGALGRPANDGQQNVWYAELSWDGAQPKIEFVPVDYDWQSLANDMRAENLPAPFVETIETGWWTTCLEILPAKERARGKF